jgi:recombination protein RecT
MLEKYKAQIALALPRHLKADRMARIALTEFRKNPKLGECDPRSVFAAIIVASQLGLEPGLMGSCYLIPYKTECQLQIGYQGFLDLVHRTGRVRSIEAHVVHKNDAFTYKIGALPPLLHEPELYTDPGEPVLVYAMAMLNTGALHIEVMTKKEIEAIRERSQAVQSAKKYGKKTPWDTDAEEMWRKTVIRRICKYLPKSVELATAYELENAADQGSQHLTIEGAAQGTFDAPEQDDSQLGRIHTMFDKLDLPGDIRDEELAKYADKLDDLETKLKAELAKGSGDAA